MKDFIKVKVSVWHLFSYNSSLGHKTSPSAGVRRLVVDVSVLHNRDAGTGIQRVVKNTWNTLSKSNTETLRLIPIFAKEDGRFYLAKANFLELPCEARLSDLEPYHARPGDVFLGLDFSPILLPRCRRLLRSWKRLGVSINLVVYDLLPHTNPQWFTRRGVRNYRRWLKLLADHADAALCISADVACQLSNFLARGRAKSHHVSVEVLRIGTEFDATCENGLPPPQLSAHGSAPIILMVGTIEPRKGYDFAMKVFERIWLSNDVVVVIVGKAGWKTKELQKNLRSHARVGRSFFWLDDVDDRQLAWLYSNSAAFFSTSLAEGLGLPLLEARSHGVPSVVTDLSVFRESADEGVVFFEVGNVDQAADFLSNAVKKSEFRSTGRFRGPTWADTVSDLLQLTCSPKFLRS